MSVDLAAYQARIVAIADDLSGISLASVSYPDEITVKLANSLPFVFVDIGEASYQSLNSGMWRITREFIALLYVQAFVPENAASEDAARAAAMPFLTSYPAHFLARTRLQRNDAGLNGIVRATITQDAGLQTASRNQVVYTGIFFRHSIVYDEQVTEL